MVPKKDTCHEIKTVAKTNTLKFSSTLVVVSDVKSYCKYAIEHVFINTLLMCPGWPRLNWCITENPSKPPRDWQPAPRTSEEVPAYVEVCISQLFIFKLVVIIMCIVAK